MAQWLINFMIASMIFFPEKTLYEKPADYGLVSEDVTFQTEDGEQLFGWFLKGPPEKGVVLYFHGNAGNISGRLSKAAGWVRAGFSVFLIDYRGYGKSTGHIRHQDDVLKDAHAALKWLLGEKKVPLEKIIFYGESLGSHPAIRLAAENKAAALVLEAPYTSFVELGKKHYPFVPGSLIRDFAFPNLEYIGQIQTPLFILHGTADEICPYEMSGRLMEKVRGTAERFSIEGGAHNNLPEAAGEDYWQKPVTFVEKYL